MKTYFIAGTDTEIGKTYCTAALLRYCKKQNLKTIAIKPLASGCEPIKSGLRNSDALTLQSEASIELPYQKVNPLAFKDPIAPHLAAKKVALNTTEFLKACQARYEYPADICLIEGVGGWLTPLNEKESVADGVKALGCPVILIVGMKLGCLNHALLTVKAIAAEGIPLAGWIANCVDPDMLALEENIHFLTQSIKAPRLARVNYGEKDIAESNVALRALFLQ